MHTEFVWKVECSSDLAEWLRKAIFMVMISTVLTPTLALAQLDTGTISGTVTDASGAAVPGAAIRIRNVETGVARNLVSNAVGRYEATALPVGNYEVRASLTGFQTLVRSGINLTVGRNAVVNMALQVGEVAQAITVSGEASFVETTTATVSNLVDERRVQEIPLNNRDLTQLALLQPGVVQMVVNVDNADPASRRPILNSSPAQTCQSIWSAIMLPHLRAASGRRALMRSMMDSRTSGS